MCANVEYKEGIVDLTRDLSELSDRLTVFMRQKLVHPDADISNVTKMPGNAGFSFGFTVHIEESSKRYVLRVPPPNARRSGTADVLRQAKVISTVSELGIPVPEIVYEGEEEVWFDSPYFIVEFLEGDTLGGDWGDSLSGKQIASMAIEAVDVLAKLHHLDWEKIVPSSGPPISLVDDVHRWDRFIDRTVDPKDLSLAPVVKKGLLERLPSEPNVGIFHGDFQWSNLFFDSDCNFKALIDWELWGVGAILNDLGWFLLFVDREAWEHPQITLAAPEPKVIIDRYVHAYGEDPGEINWYRALAAYKFSIISSLNLYLHRTGKRPDQSWELRQPSIHRLMERALELLA